MIFADAIEGAHIPITKNSHDVPWDELDPAAGGLLAPNQRIVRLSLGPRIALAGEVRLKVAALFSPINDGSLVFGESVV